MGLFARLFEGGFRTAMTILVVSLVAVCAVFAALNWLQGPKLSDARVDLAKVVLEPDQQLRFFANQPLAAVDEDMVTITPAARFTVSSTDDVVAVQFTQPLDFDTDYTVSVDGVTSAFEDRASSFRYEFTTGSASLHYLDRADPVDPSGVDRIIETELGGGDRSVVFETERIQSFVVFDGLLAVTSLTENATSTLTLVSRLDGTTEDVVLPVGVTIDQLAAANDQGVLAFTTTSAAADPVPEFSHALFSLDIAQTNTASPVVGLDGAPLTVVDWLILPGSATAVARTVGDTLLSVDLTGEAPATPLGSYADLASASPDAGTLVVGDPFGPIALSLADGTETRLEASPIGGIVPFGGDIQLLGTGVDRVQRVAVFDDATGRFASFLVFDDGDASRILYESPDGRGSIEDFDVSQNGQYVAVAVVPDVAASVSDGYAVSAASTSVTTIIIDVATGTTIGSLDGFQVAW